MMIPRRAFSRRVWLLGAAVLGATLALAQQPPSPDLPATVLRVTTRLVLVDVVVTDKDGKPVKGLTRDDFQISEDGKPQRLATFSFESPFERPAMQPEPLPPNVYTNRPEYRMPPGPLTILLLDALNTPVREQAYARDQMLRYLKTQLKPDQRTAIFALGNQLFLLQNFTTDPGLLQAALDKFLLKPSVALQREEADTPLPPEGVALLAALAPQMLANLQRFETERAFALRDSRIQMTLAVLRAIARGTAGYRGRKNLIWVSAAFPFVLVPERPEDFDLYRTHTEDMRRTATILTDAQVAVYPVDARGLVGFTMADASISGRNAAGQAMAGGEFGTVLDAQISDVTGSHQTMEKLAEDTGGKAYYNRNDIDTAMELSVADGSTYYSLGYYPEKEKWDGKFRRIEVKLAREGVKVRHRRGYYAFDPFDRPKPKEVKGDKDTKIKDEELLAALGDPLPATVVTFLAHVPPPPAPLPGFGAPVTVRFLVDAKTLSFEETSDGRRRFDADFLVAAFAPDGKVAKSLNHTVGAPLSAPSYARALEQGLRYEMKLELEPGSYQLRLIVRDNRTGLVGTADVPLVVSKP